MEMIWLLFGFFAFVTIFFIAFAYFFPEWIGITGNKAKQIQNHQQQETLPTDQATQQPTNQPTDQSAEASALDSTFFKK